MLRATHVTRSRGSSLVRPVSHWNASRKPLLRARPELNQTQLNQVRNNLSGNYVPWSAALAIVGAGAALLVYIIGDTVKPLDTQIRAVEAKVNALNATVENKFSALNTSVEDSFSALNTSVEDSFSGLEAKISALDANVDAKISALDAKVDVIFRALDSKLDSILRVLPPK